MQSPEEKAEITLNLWYIYDDMGMIYRLLVRAYVDSGSDSAKLSRLRESAKTDFWIAKQFGIPERFHVNLVTTDPDAGHSGEKRLPVIPVNVYYQMNGLEIFEDALRTIGTELPGFCPFSISQAPLVCITPIFADDDGRLFPKFNETILL